MATARADDAGPPRGGQRSGAGPGGSGSRPAASSPPDAPAARRELLFVAFFFPPLGGGGVQRSLKFVRYLPDHGWQPRVVAAEAGYWMHDESLLAEVPPDTAVRRVPFGGRRLIGMGGRAGARSRTATRWLRSVSRFVLVPDTYVGWSRRATRIVAEELARRPAALIFTTSSPDSAHLLGRAVKRATGLPWVADFRDPWTGRLSYAPPTPLHHRWQLALEGSCLREADAVVVTTPETRDDFLARHSDLSAAKFHVIPNGFDEDDFAAAAAMQTAGAARAPGAADWIPAGGFPVLHAGQLNLDRSLAPFLAGLRFYRERRRISPPPPAPRGGGDAAAVFLGPCYDWHREQVRAAGLSDAVHFLPGRTHRDAVLAMLSARMLLLLEQDSDRGRLVLPGKAFEYLRADRPILAVVPKGGAAARFVRETGAGIAVDPARPEEIAEGLARLLDGEPARPRPAASAEPYERRILTAALARLFDSVLTLRQPRR